VADGLTVAASILGIASMPDEDVADGPIGDSVPPQPMTAATAATVVMIANRRRY
jgi:hypothetical protein